MTLCIVFFSSYIEAIIATQKGAVNENNERIIGTLHEENIRANL